jgi:c-di-GMP-binding flagellar brake protein YcgR
MQVNRWDCHDRRKYQRLKLSVSVRYQVTDPIYARKYFGEQEYDAVTLDIGQGGMALLTRYDIPPRCVLSIRFRLMRMSREGVVDFSEPFEVNGEVCSNNDFDHQHRLGISFQLQDAQLTDHLGVLMRHAN